MLLDALTPRVLKCLDLYFMFDQRDVGAFEELDFSLLLKIIQWAVTQWALCLGPAHLPSLLSQVLLWLVLGGRC